MLTQRDPSKDDIITIKLSSGEEFIATFVSNEDDFVVRKPVCLVQTQQGLALPPWIMTGMSEQPVCINKNHISAWLPTNAEVTKLYLESTTGIQLAK